MSEDNKEPVGDKDIFTMIGSVTACLESAGLIVQAEEFLDEVYAAESYQEALEVCKRYLLIGL